MKRYIVIAISALILICLIIFAFTVLLISSNGSDTESIPMPKSEIIDFGLEAPINAARCMTVIDAKSGNVLFSHNAHERRGMASTTKIMTALVAIESQSPDSEFVIPKEAVGIEGSSVYLKEGERLTLRELLYCLLLESGNDAATAIAISIGGSEEEFVGLMNERAKELGLADTSFANPHGLSADNHYTTAHDLAIITAAAMEYPLFREIVATKSHSVRYDGAENGRRLVNHNKLLFSADHVIGVKTGYTKRDGKCLVSAAEKDGMTLIAVTLQDAFPTSTHKALLDYAFSSFESVSLAKAFDIESVVPIENGFLKFTTVTNSLPAEILLPKGAKISCELLLPQSICAPAEKGEIIGYAILNANGRIVYIISLETTVEIKEKKKTLAEKLFGE
ncbi:MAG: D-alanyl-D-alanine carboxypeptidase [Clostridia bacterium]|nr:D-alanyl-D-alanine carboxypeptidase [Clostridia bacterium]